MSRVPPVDLAEIAKRNNLTIREVQDILDRARQSMTTCMKRIDVSENGSINWYSVERKGVGKIKTNEGSFHEYLFHMNDMWNRYNVIVKSDLDKNLQPVFKNAAKIVLRIDSGCETGQLFGDLTCECKDQLLKAMRTIEEIGEGIIINIPNQDGRGMTLGFKLATLTLQEELTLNTVESASMLAPGGVIDVRTYAGVIAILKFFEIPVTTVLSLASNNPKKALVFEENGYTITDMLPLVIPPTADTRRHLAAKQDYLGHFQLV